MIAVDLAIDVKTAALLSTAFAFPYALIQPVLGVTGDFFGEYRMEKNPVFSRGTDGSFIISTDSASHLSFVRSGNTFKFVAYIVEP